jgi:hypothetical protein
MAVELLFNEELSSSSLSLVVGQFKLSTKKEFYFI